MTVIVLGIDPGTANTGYGVVLATGQRLAALDGGVIATESNESLERRLVRIHTRVRDLIMEHAPHAVAIEDIFFGNNARSAFSVGHARGAVMLTAGMCGGPAYSYTPPAGKQAGGGSRPAQKGPGERVGPAVLSPRKGPGAGPAPAPP